MSWNDGVTKELNDYFEQINTFGELAKESLCEQIDIEAQNVYDELENTTPKKTGGLLKSLRKTKITGRYKYYGYEIEYEGVDKYGNSYEKIANVLNYGSSTVQSRKFVTKAIRKLKGLDERANKRFKDKLSKEIKEFN